MTRVAFFSAVAAATGAVLLAIALPIVAIFTHVSPATLVHELSSQVVRDALVVSLKTTCEAQVLVLALGTPAAYVLARRFFGRSLLLTLVELPLVLPPAVAGLALLVAFGRNGLVHTSLPFTQPAVTLAAAFVGGPLYIRTAVAAFETVDPSYLDASRTLGAGPARTFFRVLVPLARAGLGAGLALSFARGLGEFGATIMFAGSLQGVTQTLPLAIYSEFDVNLDVALAISGLLVLISVAILVALKVASAWTLSPQSSVFRFAPSTSS